MKNFCLSKKISNKKILELGSVLSTGPGDYSMNKEMYDDIAYMLLSANGGYPLSQDPWGRPSKYWKELEKIHKLADGVGYDVRAVVLDKAYIYMDSFVSEYGDWYLEEDGQEPDFEETNLISVTDPLTHKEIKKLNVDMLHEKDAMNRYLTDKILEKYFNEDIRQIGHRLAFAKDVILREKEIETQRINEDDENIVYFYTAHEQALKEILDEKIDTIKKVFRDSWGPVKSVDKLYKSLVYHIRNLILYQLDLYKDDYKRLDVILAMITQLTSPYCHTAETLSKPLIEKWVEILKGTEEFKKFVLEQAPKEMRPPKKYQKLNEEDLLEEYCNNLVKLLTSKDNVIFHNKTIGERIYSAFFNFIKTILKSVGWTVMLIPRIIVGKHQSFTRESKKRRAIRHFFIDLTDALCATEGLMNNANYTENKIILNSMGNASAMDVALKKLQDNIVQRLKSLDREQGKSINVKYREQDMTLLNILKLKVDQALASDELLKYQRSDVFFNEYVTNCILLISHALEFIEECKNLIASGNTNQIDAQLLMYIKTDVIGGFASVFEGLSGALSGFNLSKIPLESFRDPNGIRHTIKESILDSMADLKNEYGAVLDIFVNDVINQRIHNTVGKYLDAEHEQTFKDCVQFWIHNNPPLGLFDANVFSPSTSESPVVRMVTDMLFEIETVANQEAQQWGAELNEARRQGDWSFLFNQQKRLAEHTKNGLATGYLNTAVNKGQYLYEIREWTKQYIKDNKLPTQKESKDKVDWSQCTDEQWKWFNIHLLEFIGDCKVATDLFGNPIVDHTGRLSIIEGGHPRAHMRFKAAYYIQRYYTLSREAFELRTSISDQMYAIERQCLRSITYKVGDKTITTKVPIIQSLDNPETYEQYKKLMLRKYQLASVYELNIVDGVVTSLSKKTDPHEIKIAQEFAKLRQIELQYYPKDVDKKILDRSLYDAIINDYQTRLRELPIGSEDHKKLKLEYERFKNYNNSRRLTDKINLIIKEVKTYDRSNKPEYNLDLYIELTDLISTRDAVRKSVQLDDVNKTLDLKRIAPNTWKELLNIDLRITEIETILNIRPTIKKNPLGSYERSAIITSQPIQVLKTPELDEHQRPRFTGESMFDYLQRVYGFAESQLKYIDADNLEKTISLLSQSVPTNDAMRLVDVNNSEDLYDTNPIGNFVKTNNLMLDDKYDDSIRERYQVNKDRYKNTQYESVKNDPLYIKIKEALNEINKCYTGSEIEGETYMLPQRQAKPKDIFWRSLPLALTAMKTKFSSIASLTSRDEEMFNENVEQILRRADGTIIDSLPVMYMSLLDDPATIDLDLVSSVTASLQEAIRYKYRKQQLALLETIRLFLEGGVNGLNTDTASDLLKLITSEMARGLYGRNTAGSGEGGRLLPFEKAYAKISKNLRSVIHQRLMGHNLMSVLKNGWDSLCNLIQTATVGLYFKPLNILRGIWKMLKSIFPAIASYNRPSAANMTQALVMYNEIGKSLGERYQNTHQWWLHRLISKTASLEFEFVDYTAKAVIVESIYDSYRLVYNPITTKHEYMNAALAELIYLQYAGDRQQGYDLWNKADKYTLRQAYIFNEKLGIAELRLDAVEIEGQTYQYVDLVRPQSTYGIKEGRSYVLENTVRNTIRQISSTVNGMLEEEDKNKLARDWRGALMVAFRGWMISQGGQYYKYGKDFYKYDQQDNMAAALSQYGEYTAGDKGYRNQLKMSQFAYRVSFLDDPDFMGMYNFNTGMIERGLHRDLIRILTRNSGSFLKAVLGGCFINAMTPGHKNKWLKNNTNASSNDYYAIQNMACAIDMIFLTTAMCMLAYSWYDGDDDDWFKALIYTGSLASIAERFSQLGPIGYGISLSEILNSVSVGTAVIEEFVYMFCLINDLIQLACDNNDPNEIINRGSFQGYSLIQKDAAYTFTLLGAIFGVDDLAIEIALESLIGDFDKRMFTGLNVNAHKNMSVSANKERFKWYGLMNPIPIVEKIANELGFPIYPQRGRKSVGGSINLDDLDAIGDLNELNNLNDLSNLNDLGGI